MMFDESCAQTFKVHRVRKSKGKKWPSLTPADAYRPRSKSATTRTKGADPPVLARSK